MSGLQGALRAHDLAQADVTPAWRAANAAFGTPDQTRAEHAWQAAQRRARDASDALLAAIRQDSAAHPDLCGALTTYDDCAAAHDRAAHPGETDPADPDLHAAETARQRWLDTFTALRQAHQDLITQARALSAHPQELS